MTEEQRMEEGRRMFQIFAARMFEQRVLTAYREKVARERQQKLLQEIEEENRRKAEQEELRAKTKDRKKERKRQQRQEKEEARMRKEAEKAAEEAKLKEIEAQKAEEQRKRKEELRLKRETERKAAEEEKKRKEEERKKRLEEEREREAEKERKRKEHAERERKKKEEAARKAKEEKELREKEAKLRKEREDKEREQREAQIQKEAAERERARIEEANKAKRDESNRRALAAMEAAAATRAQPPTGPAGYAQPLGSHSSYNSPHLHAVSPAIPKTGPIGSRPRQTSQQDGIPMSIGSPPRTPSIGTRITSNASPSTPIMHQGSLAQINIPKHTPSFPPITNVTPTSPLPPHMAPPPGVPPPQAHFGGMPMNGDMGFMGHRPSHPPGMPLGYPSSPFGPTQFSRAFPTNGMSMMPPPGMQVSMGTPTRPFMDMPQRLPPGVPISHAPASPFMNTVNPIPMSGHHRQPSGGSHEPIHRPAPIQRPSSVAPKHHGEEHDEVDEISKVMGSRALLGDDVDPLPENISPSRRSSVAQFAPSPLRQIPISSPVYGDAFGGKLIRLFAVMAAVLMMNRCLVVEPSSSW